MAQKAMLFDSSRCTGCQACAAACGAARRASLPDAETTAPQGDSYQRIADLDGNAVLAITFSERTVDPHGLVWDIGRKSCVHCASAPCVEVCPTEALVRDEETGLVLANDGRCVSCHMCALACPADVLRHGSEKGSIVKCDGCVDRVRADAPPTCVQACPLDALAWGEREEIVLKANERVTQLQERGFERACVLGVDEQGGHGVIQVLKYGAGDGARGLLASTGETPWVEGIKMAGPVSVGVLGAMAVGAVAALAVETRREQRAHATAKGVPIATVPGMIPVGDDFLAAAEAGWMEAADIPAGAAGDPVGDDAYLDGDFTDEDVARETAARKEREAAEREAERAAEMLPRIVAATPAAAAAATAAERHLYPVAFDDDPYGDAGAPSEADELGDTGEIPIVDELSDTGEIPVIDELSDTGEIPIVDELGDTGELYDVDDFRRLLAADIVAHHLAKESAAAGEGSSGLAAELEPDTADTADTDEGVDAGEGADEVADADGSTDEGVDEVADAGEDVNEGTDAAERADADESDKASEE